MVKPKDNIEPEFFPTQKDWRKWLKNNHNKFEEFWVGFYKKGSGQLSITWPESVDEALCFGWIDGIRKSIDGMSYKIRFTPRRKQSTWSSANVKRVEELIELGKMEKPGIAAFDRRDVNKTKRYSFEQKNTKFSPAYEKSFKENKIAWQFFSKQSPHFKRVLTWWVMSAKREETKLRRLNILIRDSEIGKKPEVYTLKKKGE